ncbi:MAG: VUT family protein [Mesorhizobium sp.]
MIGALAFLGFLATIPVANWMIQNVGTICLPGGPCLVPVGFGLSAPSGVLVIGSAIVLRDAVHRLLGPLPALLAITIGTVVSALIAPQSLVLASAVAFGLAELLNFAVFAPLHRRRLILAVVLSSVVAAIADSALFLWLAFGSLDHLGGQTLGKLWMTVLAVSMIYLSRQHRARVES